MANEMKITNSRTSAYDVLSDSEKATLDRARAPQKMSLRSRRRRARSKKRTALCRVSNQRLAIEKKHKRHVSHFRFSDYHTKTARTQRCTSPPKKQKSLAMKIVIINDQVLNFHSLADLAKQGVSLETRVRVARLVSQGIRNKTGPVTILGDALGGKKVTPFGGKNYQPKWSNFTPSKQSKKSNTGKPEKQASSANSPTPIVKPAEIKVEEQAPVLVRTHFEHRIDNPRKFDMLNTYFDAAAEDQDNKFPRFYVFQDLTLSELLKQSKSDLDDKTFMVDLSCLMPTIKKYIIDQGHEDGVDLQVDSRRIAALADDDGEFIKCSSYYKLAPIAYDEEADTSREICEKYPSYLNNSRLDTSGLATVDQFGEDSRGEQNVFDFEVATLFETVTLAECLALSTTSSAGANDNSKGTSSSAAVPPPVVNKEQDKSKDDESKGDKRKADESKSEKVQKAVLTPEVVRCLLQYDGNGGLHIVTTYVKDKFSDEAFHDTMPLNTIYDIADKIRGRHIIQESVNQVHLST